MRILICDDDALMREHIQHYIEIYFKSIDKKDFEIVSYPNGESLLEDKGEKDIVFLDIEMPGKDGICLASELKNTGNNIIIFVVTAYMEYLDDAMRLHVFRYMSKPLERQRFFRNMRDALEQYYSREGEIPVETKEGVYTLPVSSILVIEAQGKKVTVHTEKKDFISVHTMQYWQERLPKNIFFQTHRSFLVNMRHVAEFDHTLVHMAGGTCQAYLTKRKYRAFKDAYLLYMESRG